MEGGGGGGGGGEAAFNREFTTNLVTQSKAL